MKIINKMWLVLIDQRFKHRDYANSRNGTFQPNKVLLTDFKVFSFTNIEKIFTPSLSVENFVQ